MVNVNENFLELNESYLFSTIAKKVEEYKSQNNVSKIINLGIGDVTLPIPKVASEAMEKAAKELSNIDTFRGYGPEQGYDFLRGKIMIEDYAKRGVNIEIDEIFVSDGAKCDMGNICDIFSKENKVAITDPVYPVYLDTNVMSGRAGKYNIQKGIYDNVIYLPCNKENKFKPDIPENIIPSIIYLCSPNNPTGTAFTRKELTKWVNYAKNNRAVILFDGAYEAFITDEDIPHSIYEIERCKRCGY